MPLSSGARRHTAAFVSILLAAVSVTAVAEPAGLRVATDFEGGSARVVSLDAATQTIRLTPAGDSARGMPTWWFLRVDGVDASRPLVLEVVARAFVSPNAKDTKSLNPGWTLPTRAAISMDGATWTQTAPGELWLAWGPPFTPTHAADYVQRIAREHPSAAQSFTLAESREGRAVPALRIAEGKREPRERRAVWVIARQHAWECGGSWVAAGLTDWLLSADESAAALRGVAEVFVVPVMDVDHVATGDGGKHALPQDHNRDWSEAPHWPEVAAAQKRILESAKEGRLDVFLDLHNPSPGATVQAFYVHNPPYVGEKAAAAQQRFIDRARELFGEVRLQDGNPSVPAHLPIWERISTPWALNHGHASTVSLTVETPWNTPDSTAEGYRDVGRKLSMALARHLSVAE